MKKHHLCKNHLLAFTLLLTSALLWGCSNTADSNQSEETVAAESVPAKPNEIADSSSEADDKEEKNPKNSQSEPLEKEIENTSSFNTVNQSELEQAKIRYQYAEILSRIIGAHELPDGTSLEETNGIVGDMSDNSYAILDIDGDGLEELLVSYSTASMAGMFEAVYGYHPETDRLTCELMNFPALEYYDNGVIIAYASHNHSHGDFWPLGFYQYDAASDTYQQFAYVESWDKEIAEVFFDYEKDEQLPFPTELDTDKDGVLYNIQEGASGNYTWNYDDYHYNEEDYQKWYQSYLENATQLTPDYQALTYENFQPYVKDYLTLLQTKKEETDPSAGTDIGLLFIMEGYSVTDISEMLSEDYHITTNYPYADFEDEWIGEYAHNDAFYFINLNLGSIQYCDTQVEDITIYDLYPGMMETDAIQKLTAYGFYQNSGDAENGYSYITGNGFGNVAIWYKAENGKLQEISISPYCAYAG